MSGGSFSYICYKGVDQLGQYTEEIESMAKMLRELGYPSISEDTKKVLDRFRGDDKWLQWLQRLQNVWHAVEWCTSGDWGLEDVKRATAKYEAEQQQPDQEGFTVHDFHREIVQRKIKLKQAIQRAQRERNHNAHRNAAARLDEVKRTEKILRMLSPGCDQCVDGTITDQAMSHAKDKIKLTVISYRCDYCESMKNGREGK